MLVSSSVVCVQALWGTPQSAVVDRHCIGICEQALAGAATQELQHIDLSDCLFTGGKHSICVSASLSGVVPIA